MSELSTLAQSIYANEFDSDSSAINQSSILGWLQENLGLLNTLLNTNFSGEDPGFGLEEIAIYKQIYLYNHYSKQSRNILRGIVSTVSSDNVLMVADGDNKIQFANKNEISKTYRDLARDAKQTLDMMVAKYNIYASKPLQVGGYEAGSISSSCVEISPSVLDGGLDN